MGPREAGEESIALLLTRPRARASQAGWYNRAQEIGLPASSTLAKYECVSRLHVSPIPGAKPIGKITRGDIIDLVAVSEAKVSAYQAVETLKLTRMLLNEW